MHLQGHKQTNKRFLTYFRVKFLVSNKNLNMGYTVLNSTYKGTKGMR